MEGKVTGAGWPYVQVQLLAGYIDGNKTVACWIHRSQKDMCAGWIKWNEAGWINYRQGKGNASLLYALNAKYSLITGQIQERESGCWLFEMHRGKYIQSVGRL